MVPQLFVCDDIMQKRAAQPGGCTNSSDNFSTDVRPDVSTLFAGSNVQPPGWAALPEVPAIWQMKISGP